MSDPQVGELWSRLLDGPPLSGAERDALAAVLAADTALRRRCLEELALHEELRANGRLSVEDPDFVATVQRQCSFSGGTGRFARRVRSRLPRRRRSSVLRWWPLLAAGLVLALLLPLLGRSQAVAPIGWVVTAAGAGHVSGEVLAPGTHLDGDLQLSGAGGMQVELSAARTVVPSLDAPTWRLEHGTLSADIAPRNGRANFVVETPHATVEVVGTRFTVRVDASTRLTVEHGTVRFGRPGDWQLIGAGQSATLPVPAATAVTPPLASLLADYRFDSGSGTTIRDRSAHGLDLEASDPGRIRWTADGLTLTAETHLLAAGDAAALVDACVQAGGISIAADLTIPGPPPFPTVTIGPARIVTLSEDAERRNATLGYGEIGLDRPAIVLRLRQGDVLNQATANGQPTHWIPAPPPGRCRLLVTYQEGVGARWFVDGVERPGQVWDVHRRQATSATGSLKTWSRAARLGVGGEVVPFVGDGGLRPWLGTLHSVAVYGGALDPATASRLSTP